MVSELNVVPSLRESLFDSNTKSILKDIGELSLDSIMQDGLLKDIPIVNTLVSLGKLGANIHDHNMLRQALIFLNEFNNHTIDQDKLNAYRESINNDSSKAEKELGRIIILLNSSIDDIKAQLLAAFYVIYINEVRDWYRFCVLINYLLFWKTTHSYGLRFIIHESILLLV